MHPKVASERAGHSRVGFTLDRYSHVIPSLQEDAAARIDAASARPSRARVANGWQIAYIAGGGVARNPRNPWAGGVAERLKAAVC